MNGTLRSVEYDIPETVHSDAFLRPLNCETRSHVLNSCEAKSNEHNSQDKVQMAPRSEERIERENSPARLTFGFCRVTRRTDDEMMRWTPCVRVLRDCVRVQPHDHHAARNATTTSRTRAPVTGLVMKTQLTSFCRVVWGLWLRDVDNLYNIAISSALDHSNKFNGTHVGRHACD